LIQAAPLSAGDSIAVVSPSGPVLEHHLRSGREALERWGYDLIDFEPFLRHPRGFLAGHDHERVGNILRAWRDERVSAIWCSRGGYGAMRLLPRLEAHRNELAGNPKLLMGFSDVTALHLWFAGVVGIPTVHGPVLKSFEAQSEDIAHARAALTGRSADELVFRARPVRGGSAEGIALGGNLSLVVAMLTTPYCPALDGAVLFLEDVSEEDYRLDRLFTALRLSKRASSPAAIVLGEFSECGGTYVSESEIPDFVEELASEFGCPVVADFPMGHGRRNIAIPFGVQARVDGESGRVSFSSDAVAP